MKTLAALAVSLLFLLSPAQTAQRTLADLRSSVARVMVLQDSGNMGFCTATAIAPGQWLTAAHCHVGIMQVAGDAVTIIKEDKNSDLMLITGPAAQGFEIATKEPALGDEVVFIGWPAEWWENTPLLFFGHLSAEGQSFPVDGLPAHPLNVFHEGGGPGMSGGPIVNKAGQLIGVSEGAARYPSVSVVSPTVKVLRKFLGLK